MSIITKDIRTAKRWVFVGNIAREKRAARRAARRTEKQALRIKGEDFEPRLKPRLTARDIC